MVYGRLRGAKKEAALNPSFYLSSDVVSIARSLLGKELITEIEGEKTGGIIIETESYAGISDRASHAYNGRRTPRTEVMYQKGGVAYVYLCYGIHSLLNVVTAEEGTPHAVLIRALHPTIGLPTMLKRRKKREIDTTLTSGPGALCAALGIDRRHNGLPFNGGALLIQETELPPLDILVSPRIGVDYAGADALLPYRFRLSIYTNNTN